MNSSIPFLSTLLVMFFITSLHAQDEVYEEDEEVVYLYPENDPSPEGQQGFVEELLDYAGYVPERIEIYQNLPNNARVFRVRFDSINGAFIFIRWDKAKKENYVANKMIDPGVYYNLKTAREIMRKQTNQANFVKEDAALQAGDQDKISSGELQDLREEFKLKEEERKANELNQQSKKRTPRMRRQRRQLKKNN